MDRTEKQTMIDFVHGVLANNSTVVVVHNKGLTVAEMSTLRGKIRAAGAGFKVAKNRLVLRALEGTNFGVIKDHMKGPTALVYANEPVAMAKVLAEFAKQNEKLVLLGGAFGTHRLDAKGVAALATMPSLDELRAKIVGLLQAPATRIAGVLQAPAGQVARVMGAHARKSA